MTRGACSLLITFLLAFPGGAFAQTTPKFTKNKRQFVANNADAWKVLAATPGCMANPVTDACAQGAIVRVTTECGASALFFQRANTTWQIVNLGLILASAAFTAVGASTTIANAKIFSTLGGTTGLGATTTTINANSTGDQTGLASVNTTLAAFLTFLKTGAVPGAAAAGAGAAPDNPTIYKLAPVFAAQCEAAATGSSGK
ncbi:MAG TPA: hypothetical protein VK752_06280 [Bryobacteraceae bacterium]|jgi:hypothetical protein|nr:hypothetical protein [Bryobacteraceae bacterium]